jgi:lipopolysaccharide exporter
VSSIRGRVEDAPWRPGPREVEQRAVRGVVLLVGRTGGLQALTLAGTIALARLLTPRDYGTFAIALTMQQFGRFIVDLGLPTALIRRHEDMTVREEHAVAGLAVSGASAVAALLLLVAFVFLPLAGVRSVVLRVAAVTALALPLYTARIIPTIRLERRLEFGKMVAIEVAETIAFYAFAIPAAVLGLGPFSLAGAIVVGAALSSLVATFIRPWWFGWSVDLGAVRSMLGFSLRASLLAPIQLLRELLALVVLAVVGGPALSGHYNLAARLFSLQLSISYAVQRVALTALSRGESSDERNRQGARAVVVTTLLAAFPVAVVAASARVLVVVAFGQRWAPTVGVVEWSALGWLIMSGVTSVLVSLALAHGDARVPLRAMLAQAVVVVGAAAGLGAAVGPRGAGMAVTLGALTGAVMLVWSNKSFRGASLAMTVRIFLVTACAVVIATRVPEAKTLPGLAGAIAVSGVIWMALAMVFMRGELIRSKRLLARHLRISPR